MYRLAVALPAFTFHERGPGLPGLAEHPIGMEISAEDSVMGWTAGRKKTVMCRCKRAWLPPSATWLFPPRCATHTTGGWYLEWGGYEHREHSL